MAMSISLVALINYNLPVDAESINGILEEDKLYAPISEIVIKMGGAVRRNEEAKSYVFDINDSNIKITDGCFFAEIDGEIVPFETDKYEDTIIPVYKPAVYKEGQVYIPVDYIKEEVGLDIKVEGEKVTFKSKKLEEVIPEEKKDESKEEGEDSSEQEVETITTPNNSNDTPKIEHTKPETKPNKDENKNNTQTPPNNQTSTYRISAGRKRNAWCN